MSKLKRNLDVIFAETTNNGGDGRRYVAKAFSDHGPGWGVYDRRTSRFLKDREVAALSLDQARQPELLQ